MPWYRLFSPRAWAAGRAQSGDGQLGAAASNRSTGRISCIIKSRGPMYAREPARQLPHQVLTLEYMQCFLLSFPVIGA